jgi:hypothetical protein
LTLSNKAKKEQTAKEPNKMGPFIDVEIFEHMILGYGIYTN